MSDMSNVLERYVASCDDVAASFSDMTREQLLARPIEGKWSSLQVLCHIVDTDLLTATRMRAALASDTPRQLGLTTEQIMGMLAWESRDAQEEIGLFISLRQSTARIIRSFADDPSDRALVFIKPDGSEVRKTVGQLLHGVTHHVHHHLSHIRDKRRSLGLPAEQ